MAAGYLMLSPEGGLSRYLAEIRNFPMLEPEEEYMLAKRWVDHQDPNAAHQLVTSHLRLVAKIAMGYRGYGLPVSELISEGNIGLMQGVKKFEPDRGFRLATYAMWWIRASIQEFILRSWSLVKIGTTAAQKKLFFNLRKAKSSIKAIEKSIMESGLGLTPSNDGNLIRLTLPELTEEAADALLLRGSAGTDLAVRDSAALSRLVRKITGIEDFCRSR